MSVRLLLSHVPPKFFLYLRWLPLTLTSAMALVYVPLMSGFAVVSNPTCSFWPIWRGLPEILQNTVHLRSFGILFLIAALTYRKHRVVKAAITVLAISIAVEAEQAYFWGNCEVADLLPNLVAIAGGAVLFVVASYGISHFRYGRG